jgi:hypothetical protein
LDDDVIKQVHVPSKQRKITSGELAANGIIMTVLRMSKMVTSVNGMTSANGSTTPYATKNAIELPRFFTTKNQMMTLIIRLITD